MKIFQFDGQGMYGNGVAIVAANTKEEAFRILCQDESQKYAVNMFDRNGDWFFTEEECVYKLHEYYDIEHCSEIKDLQTSCVAPKVILERSYYE